MTRLLAFAAVLGVAAATAGSALAGNGPPAPSFYVDGTMYRTIATPTDLSGDAEHIEPHEKHPGRQRLHFGQHAHAALVFLVPVVILCWPIAQGYFLGGLHSDQYVAGYSFRLFGAERFLETGRIPQWNPYLFGGMPFIAASSGDIFYPTAWLRWIMPVGTAMALGFAVHLFLAGLFAYLFLRALRCRWAGALVGGLAYELTGILASLAHPGHDGKLFVSALAPLLLLALTRAIRDRRDAAYGLVALTVGLCILTPHPQMT